ncbi:MAG: hypothetical protein BMS9Abin36_1739 [Gammaproteobacteria bacterium]|nr:MAG: hypothetical protein BMS9Abin36_1739 [Gammaproteobacteria bacterium]
MKSKMKLNWRQAGIALVLGMVSFTVMAMGNTGESKKVSIDDKIVGASYYWYDGDKKRSITVNSNVIAEFGRGESVVKDVISGARDVTPKVPAGARLWDVSEGGGAAKAMEAVSNIKASPVFHDGRSTSTSRRALPGGIIVTFKDGWDAQRVQDWAKSRNLTIESKMNFGNIYVIATDVGMSALTLANQIHESGEVVSAQPNWWKEITTR